MSIEEAHPITFDWLFEGNQKAADRGVKTTILDWLRTGTGVYYVSGKAESGKSTPMKFFYDHPKTVAALRTWAKGAGKEVLTASFFFWNAGTDMQKSQQGLLQTPLYNILRQSPALVFSVCPSRWQESRQTEPPWTHAELRQTFSRLREQSMATRSCFFIDGLDEFDGDHMETIDVINSFTSSNNIKICFSSRPWAVFEQAYGANFGLKLKVHELTRVDITRFVTDKLAEVTQFQRLKSTDRHYEKLVLEIVDKSNVIFLWVFLVVQSLRRVLLTLIPSLNPKEGYGSFQRIGRLF